VKYPIKFEVIELNFHFKKAQGILFYFKCNELCSHIGYWTEIVFKCNELCSHIGYWTEIVSDYGNYYHEAILKIIFHEKNTIWAKQLE